MNESVQAAEKAGRGIFKHLDLRDAMRSVATVVGLNITDMAENIARKIAGMSKETEATMRSIEQLSTQVADRTIAAMRSKLDLQDQYTLSLQDQEKLERKIADNIGNTAELQAEQLRDKLALLDKQAESEKLLASIQKDSADKYAESQKNEKAWLDSIAKVKADDAEKTKKIFAEEAEWITKHVSLEAKLRDQKLEAMSLDDRIAERVKIISELKDKIAKSDKDSNDYLELQIRLGDENKKLDEDRKTLAEQTAVAEKSVTEEKAKQVEIGRTGRGDSALTDRELERKVGEIKKDLFSRTVNNTGQYDFLGEQQKFELQKAQREIDLRTSVRRTASAFGADRAFESNPGLSESRFKEIISGIDNSASGQIAKGLEDLNKQLRAGIPTVFTGGTS